MFEAIAQWFSEVWTSISEAVYHGIIEDNRWKWYLDGLKETLLISLCAVAIGSVIGIIVALIKYTNKKFDTFKVLNVICDIYLTIFRGTPVYVQLFIMYLIILVGVEPFIVCIATFGINSGAYVAEIIRGGLESVDEGQLEAGSSLGLSKVQVMTRIILPQGFRRALPSLGNEFIALVKETAIVGTIGEIDVTKVAERIMARTYEPFVPYIFIALLYLVVVVILTQLLKILERRLSKGDRQRFRDKH